jgi:hypothetical protein
MSTLAIDTYRLLTALKGTGKSANFTAEEIAGAVHVAQEGADLLTRAEFGVRMDAFEKRMDGLDARMDAFDGRMDAYDARMDAFVERMDAFVARLVAMEERFDAKLEAVRADLRAEIKASQTQSLLWLSGLVLASNGMVIALLARLAHVI